jgi:hypothetical protein
MLRLLVTHSLQEKRWGSVPAVIMRELQRAAAGAETSPPPPAAAVLRPGTRLVREWQGRQVDVLVTEDGFVWEERSYPSLSAIARAATGRIGPVLASSELSVVADRRYRCAVYTRKSTEDGLDQEFNSLDAQSIIC